LSRPTFQLLPTPLIVGRCRGEDLFWLTSLARFPVSRSVCLVTCLPNLGDTRSTSHSVPTDTLGFALAPGPASSLPSRTDASAMAQFSMELRDMKAVHALNTLSQISETQLDTQAIMHELSV